MSVLSDNDWAFFRKNGYVVVPNAVPQDHLDATIEATFDFLGAVATLEIVSMLNCPIAASRRYTEIRASC